MKNRLSDAEWRVMETLWENPPRTIMEITNTLKAETGWTKYTVMSFLKRMEEKGAVHFEEGGRAKLYFPDWSREDASIQETENFLKKVFHGSAGMMINAMVKQKALTETEIQELYQILDSHEDSALN